MNVTTYRIALLCGDLTLCVSGGFVKRSEGEYGILYANVRLDVLLCVEVMSNLKSNSLN